MKRKIILWVILVLFLGCGGGIGYYYWYEGSHYLKTEDARLAGDIYRVIPKISGKLVSLQMTEGDRVVADQIIGQQETSNLSTASLDHSILRSPIEGTIIKTLANEGEIVSPGQPVAMVVDMNQLYVSANIEETEINKIKLGNTVEFTVDAFSGYTFKGKIMEIGEATASTFALLPAANTSGNFTKVTQRIPIKISIDDQQGVPLAPGMSSIIKIHIKEKVGE